MNGTPGGSPTALRRIMLKNELPTGVLLAAVIAVVASVLVATGESVSVDQPIIEFE